MRASRGGTRRGRVKPPENQGNWIIAGEVGSDDFKSNIFEQIRQREKVFEGTGRDSRKTRGEGGKLQTKKMSKDKRIIF